MTPGSAQFNVAFPITKHDTANIEKFTQHGPTDAVYVGGAGVVAAVLPDDSVVNFTCVAGQVLPVTVKRVNSTNTTATLMVALWQV